MLFYLLEYLRQPVPSISPICINYISKLLAQIILIKPYDLFLFFQREQEIAPFLFPSADENE